MVSKEINRVKGGALPLKEPVALGVPVTLAEWIEEEILPAREQLGSFTWEIH